MALLGVLVLTSAACGADDTGGDDEIVLDGRTFLSTGVTEDGAERPLVDGTRLTLRFEGGRLIASAGCNTLGGTYALDSTTLRVGLLATTEMGCDPVRHAQDQWLGDILSGDPTVALSDDELTLTSGGTVITLLDREVADPDRPLVGAVWTLETIIEGDAASSIPQGVIATIEFADDGRVTMNTGCNTGGGEVEIGEATMTFGPITLTERACEPAAMEVEAAVVALLAGTVEYEIEASLLSLRGPSTGLDFRSG